MSRLKSFGFLSILFATLFLGLFTLNSECRANSPDEKEVKSVINAWLTEWNSQDKEGVLDLFSDDAGIAKGKGKKLLTKKQYSKEVSRRLAKNKNIKAGDPIISINGETAEAVVPMKFPSLGCSADVVFLIRKYGNVCKIYRFSTKNLRKP